MNQWKSAYAVETKARTLADAFKDADVVLRPVGQGRVHPGHDQVDGAEADHLRHGQSRPRDHRRGGRRDPRRRHHGDRALRLSEPGQQRARLPLHLPRRARRARDHHQHGNEDRGGARAGRARARGRARRGRRRLRRAAEIRPRLHHPGAVRPAADLLRAAGGGQGRHGHRRGAQADRRHGRLPRARCARASIRSRACCSGCTSGCAGGRSAWSSPRARRSRSSAPPRASCSRGSAPRCWSAARTACAPAAAQLGVELGGGIEIINAALSQRNAAYAAYLYERLQRRGYLLRDVPAPGQPGPQPLRRPAWWRSATPTPW